MKRIDVVYCVDVGSVRRKGGFAWQRRAGSTWSDSNASEGAPIETLVKQVGSDLDNGLAVALGFECPLFIPLANDSADLGRAREGESAGRPKSARPWSAGAGAAALATGAVQVAWVLRELRKGRKKHRAFLNFKEFMKAGTGLLLWEAFVSDKGKGRNDLEDAKQGVLAFDNATVGGNPVGDIKTGPEAQAYSLVGAAMLLTGWTGRTGVLHEECLAFRAKKQERGTWASRRQTRPAA